MIDFGGVGGERGHLIQNSLVAKLSLWSGMENGELALEEVRETEPNSKQTEAARGVAVLVGASDFSLLPLFSGGRTFRVFPQRTELGTEGAAVTWGVFGCS